jgi:hypothetical protein
MAERSASVPCLHALRPKVRGTPKDVWSLGATEHSGPGRTTAFTLERFSSSVSDAYLYRFDLPEESLESVAIKMRGAEGNGDRSRHAVGIAVMGRLPRAVASSSTLRKNSRAGKKDVPQGLKAELFSIVYGSTKVVP